MTLVIKRLKAFGIDYLIILIYIALLSGTTLFIAEIFSLSLDYIDPVYGQIIGFTTLTLPVILYFTLFENSKHAGTPGKRKFDLQVVSANQSPASFGQLLGRNIVKFLPWEMAHFFVYRLIDYSRKDVPTPGWVLAGLVASQVLAFIYILFVFIKNHRTVYEWISSTCVMEKKQS